MISLRNISIAFILTAISLPAFAEPTGKASSMVDSLRVRSMPNMSAEVVGSLAKGEAVSLIEKSTFTTQVDDLEDYWYRVAPGAKFQGWVFGGYLVPAKTDKLMEIRFATNISPCEAEGAINDICIIETTGLGAKNAELTAGIKVILLDAESSKTCAAKTVDHVHSVSPIASDLATRLKVPESCGDVSHYDFGVIGRRKVEYKNNILVQVLDKTQIIKLNETIKKTNILPYTPKDLPKVLEFPDSQKKTFFAEYTDQDGYNEKEIKVVNGVPEGLYLEGCVGLLNPFQLYHHYYLRFSYGPCESEIFGYDIKQID